MENVVRSYPIGVKELMGMIDKGMRDLRRAEVSEEQRRLDAEADARDAARQDYVARRTPELVRQYRMDESRLADAAEEAGRHFSTGMALAYRNDDDAELGRLLRARIDEHLRSEAADAAEDEGYVMFPELPL